MTLAQVWRRVWNMVSHGSVLAVDDAAGVLKMQVKIGYMEVHDGRVTIQQFGFSSVPPIGSDATLLFLSGDRSNGVVIGTNHQGSRPTGRKAGEVSMFNNFGMSIFLSQDGIVIECAGQPMTINGDLRVTGEVYRGWGGADQVDLGEHVHGDVQPGGGSTSPPIAGT